VYSGFHIYVGNIIKNSSNLNVRSKFTCVYTIFVIACLSNWASVQQAKDISGGIAENIVL